MAGRAAFGGDNDQAVPIGDIGHRRGARLAAFRATCGQEQEGRVGKISANLAVVGAKLIDSVLVKIVVLAHVNLLIAWVTYGGGTRSRLRQSCSSETKEFRLTLSPLIFSFHLL